METAAALITLSSLCGAEQTYHMHCIRKLGRGYCRNPAIENDCFVDMSFQAQGIAQQVKKSCAHLQALQLPHAALPSCNAVLGITCKILLLLLLPPLADDENNLHIMLGHDTSVDDHW